MIVEAIRRFVDRHHIDPCGIVVACSGGADSTALLLGLSEFRASGFTLFCAHVNHHLRGVESDADEAFVRAACERMAIAFTALDGTLTEESIRAAGIEAAAREVRNRLLHDERDRRGARLIATAHQRNDQAETVVMRILTGSGIGGLRAIHETRHDGVIRPLLGVGRHQIEAFLAERGIEPRRDRMNDDVRFLRTRVRAALRDLDEATLARIASVAGAAQELWPLLEQLVGGAAEVEADDDETRFLSWPDDPWMQRALLLRHIRRLDPSSRDVTASALERLTASRDAIRRVSVTRSLELVRASRGLTLRRKPTRTEDFEFELVPGDTIAIPQFGATLRIDTTGTTAAREWTDADRRARSQLFQLPPGAEPRFVVRNRREGDRFQPLGMARDKKLKDFLIDRKIERSVRDAIPLLLWNDQIVWVAGVEVSERFRVSGSDGVQCEVKLANEIQNGQAVDQR